MRHPCPGILVGESCQYRSCIGVRSCLSSPYKWIPMYVVSKKKINQSKKLYKVSLLESMYIPLLPNPAVWPSFSGYTDMNLGYIIGWT